MEKLKNSINDNVKTLKDITGNSKDIIYKDHKLGKKQIKIIYSEAMCDSSVLNDFILRYLNTMDTDFKGNIINYLNETVPVGNSKIVDNFDDLTVNLYSGFLIVLSNSSSSSVCFNSRATLDSGISIADNEVVIKGPRDAFTENYNTNIGMIRRRIKSKNLWLEEVVVGSEGKTKVGIMYMNQIAEPELVKRVVDKIKNIDIDLLFGTNYISQMTEAQSKNPFPKFLTTERPDHIALSLMDGKIIILLENTSQVIIIPTFFIDFFNSTEDYYIAPINANFNRIVRIIAFIISIITPAVYIALVAYNQEAIPTSLLVSIATQRTGVPFPSILELLLMMITFEVLKETDIRMPNAMGSSLSIVGSLVLGQAAVQAGIFSPIMVIVVALTVISGLIINSFDFTNAIRIWRYFLLVLAATFGLVGLFIGVLILIINITSIKSYGKPFLFPTAPFFPKEQNNNIFITDKRKFKQRNSILAKKKPSKQEDLI